MKVTILIPHWRTGKMTAYAVAQHLKFKGRHEIDIVVIDNNAGDGSTKYLMPMMEYGVTIVDYPKELMQSHGIAFDYVLPHIKTDYFICTESDSFPTEDHWLDLYENLINDNVDCAGSLLKLSGGEFLHSTGAMYKTESWWEAKEYCDKIEFRYFRNMAMKEGFACHLMVHDSILNQVLDTPEDYIEIAPAYLPYTKEKALELLNQYAPTRGPFHNGMGEAEESIKSYGRRSCVTDAPKIILTNRHKLIKRIGYEPSQWFSYWHFAMKKNVVFIPTHTKWINDQPGTQQEYTVMQNGFKHLWGISAWMDGDPENEFAKVKQPLPDLLYATLPEHLKIPQ